MNRIEEQENDLEIRQRGTKSRLFYQSTFSIHSHLYIVTMPHKARDKKPEEPFEGLSKWIESKHVGYKCRLVSKAISGTFANILCRSS
jgi:hypothetical protein